MDGTVEQCCNWDYLECIAQFHEKDEEAVKFLRAHNVLPVQVECPSCRTPCSFCKEGHIWRCPGSVFIPKKKKRKYCGYSVSDYRGTFLENSPLPPWKLLLFVNQFLSNSWNHMTVVESLHMSSRSSLAWWLHCSEVVNEWLSNQEALGGPGVEIEIGEKVIVENGLNKDKTERKVWLFGGIERESKRKFVILLKDQQRDKATLQPLIKKYVKMGSIIYTKSWEAFDQLSELGYTHYALNPSESFVQGVDSNIHIQNIIRLWRDVKKCLKKPGVKTKYLDQHLAQCLFLKSCQSHGQRFHNFFIQASQLYPPISRQQVEDAENSVSGIISLSKPPVNGQKADEEVEDSISDSAQAGGINLQVNQGAEVGENIVEVYIQI